MRNISLHWKRRLSVNEYLQKSLENGELWVGEYDDGYAAAMIVNHKCNEEYKSVEWSVSAEENEFLVVHALCVLTTLQGKGIAGAMVKKVIEIAENANQKAIRLDVLEGNLPAEKLYLKHGFRYVDSVQMFSRTRGGRPSSCLSMLFQMMFSNEPSNGKIVHIKRQK